ncbi:hypothetical protein H4219_002849 [Mycoemilia scoparia]|uniref:Uncharacterized protein n=1 Tax=Mycoemilia scoparia TaxID=417184 RepID=A0A9W8DU75_9FUNG|nr:hypothetical protein H4219_002849 [Mycoemilia scoparia]
MTSTEMVYLFLLGTPMVIWYFMNNAKGFPTISRIFKRPKQPIEIERQLAIVAESFSAFSKDSTKTSQQLFIDYFKALIPMLSNVLDQYNTENTTEITCQYEDLLIKASCGIVQYIVVKKKYDLMFDNNLEAAKSLIRQVKIYFENPTSPYTDIDMLYCLWRLNFSANAVLAYFGITHIVVEKVIKCKVNDGKTVTREYVNLMEDINTLLSKVLAKFTIKMAKVHSFKDSKENGVEYMNRQINVRVGANTRPLKANMERVFDDLFGKLGGGTTSSANDTCLHKPQPILLNFSSAMSLVDFLQNTNDFAGYWEIVNIDKEH